MPRDREEPDAVVLAPDAGRVIPWKNCRGTTTELALWPAHAAFERGDFDWRISCSAVDAAGPFSVFPDCDRILVVTQGTGLVLDHGDAAPRARPRRHEPYLFAGDWPTSAEVLEGPIADFNVIYRRGRVRAAVEVLRLGRRASRESLSAGHVFVHVLAGSLAARVTRAEQPFALAARASLWLRDAGAGDELELAGSADDTLVIVVQLWPVDGTPDG